MEIHRFIALSICAMFHEAGITALDLNSAPSFLLDMLDVGTTMTYHLCSKVEARDWLEINGNALFWPFALQVVSSHELFRACAYSSKFITLNLIRLSTSKTSLVHKIRQFLLHKLVYLLDSFFKTVFRSACDVKVKRRVLLG